MQKWITSIAALLLCWALLYIAPLKFPASHAPTGEIDFETYRPLDSETRNPIDVLSLNMPMLALHGPGGNEIALQYGVEYESFFFGGTADEFAAVGLDRTDLNIVGAIKVAGNDANLDISADRRNARLKNGQTVYYGVKIKPVARGKVTGVTFVLTTVPTSGVPDIVNNSFNIKYVESVGGRAGDVKSDSTAGKAYQVINPAGDFLYYFSFTAVVRSGGIQTTIVPHFFGGAMVRGITPDRLQCCCAHTKKPLPRVPEITYCWWYGFGYIGNWFVSCYRASLARAVNGNTANVPCDGPEATGVEIAITGDGFERIRNELTPDQIKITDEQGSVARVTEATIVSDTEIKAKIDITACRPGIKTVKIEGAGGFTTLTLIKVVQDIPDTIVGQMRGQATRLLGTQEKLALTTTLTPGSEGKQNVIFAPAKYQIYDVTCVTRINDTTVTTTSTGGCNNITTTVVQGTCIPGAGEDNVTVSGQGFTCTAPVRNAEINLTADLPEEKEENPGSFLCVGETKPVALTVSSPSTYSYKVSLSMKTTSGSSPVIQVFDSEGAPILAGDGTTTLFSGKGATDIAKNLFVKGLSPGVACLTATYSDSTGCKSDAIKFTVMNLLTLTATDKANAGNNISDATEGTEITPVLHVYEDDAGKAVVILTVTTDPATGDVLQRVKYVVEGATADPAVGTFGPAKPTEVTLTPTNGNRTYTITAWLDCDNDGNRDPGETTRVVEVVVERLEKLRVADSANPGYYVEDGAPGGPDPVMYFCNRNPVNLKLSLALLPPEAEKAKALWIVEGNTAVPPKGNFATDPEVTLTAANDGSREFTVKAGFDRNGNGALDPDEVTRAVAVVLEKVELTLPPYVAVGATANGSLTLAGGSTAGKWFLEYEAASLKIEKANGATVTPGDLHSAILPQTIVLRLTALKAGTSTVKAVFIPEGEQAGCMDQKTASLVDIDIDVDSDNNNYTVAPYQSPPDRSPGEERIEDDMELLGKVMGANDNDDDRDGLLDMTDFNNPQERDFVPLVLEIPEPVDVVKSRIRITVPATLRVWTKAGQVVRNPQSAKAGGDVVEGGDYDDLSLLGLTNANRTVTLYIEGLAPSTGRGTERIVVELDPDGAGEVAGYVTSDAVRLTVVRPDVDVDTNHDGEITPADDPDEASRGYTTWRGEVGWRPFDTNIEPSPSVLFAGVPAPFDAQLVMTEAPAGGKITIIGVNPATGKPKFLLFDTPGRSWRLDDISWWKTWGWAFWPGDYTVSPVTFTVPGTYRFQFRLAIDGGFSIADEVMIEVKEDDVSDLAIRMDGNRDGKIDFADPADKKYLFWVNDDRDIIHENEGMLQEDDVQVADQKDCDDILIGNTLLGNIIIYGSRDFEDFARLHLMIDPKYFYNGATVTLGFGPIVSGNPSVNIFEAIDETDKYLFDEATAHSQVQKKRIERIGSTEVPLDMQYLRGDRMYLIFEGCTAGVGYLTLTARDREGNIVARKQIFLDLREITEFYEKYQVDWNDTTNQISGGYTKRVEPTYKPSSDDYLLYVHGYNLREWEKDRWGEAMFKRLWWLGYTGHCGLYSWPATFDGWTDVPTPHQYDDSELRAWNSANQLQNLLISLKNKYPGKVRVIAHSQGNIVSGEALRNVQPPLLHTYIATQAAISANCYDQTIPRYPFTEDTPDIYGHFYSGKAGNNPEDLPYLTTVGVPTSRMVRFYNQEDFALNWWAYNNRVKPDDTLGYHYGYKPHIPNNYDSYDQTRDIFYNDIFIGGFVEREHLLLPEDRYRVFSYIAESRSLALGVIPGTVAGFNSGWDLESEMGYDNQHYSHSRQFRSNMVMEQWYWRQVILRADLPTVQ